MTFGLEKFIQAGPYKYIVVVERIMALLEEGLSARYFHRLPTFEEFSVDIEPSNIPAVFYGAVRSWEAIDKWNPSDGGLDYLQETSGSAVVEAMLSNSAPVFYGDLKSHERVPIPFSTFIASCKSYQQKVATSKRSEEDTELDYTKADHTFLSDIPDLIFLAQVPILNEENKETCPLENLRGDLELPLFLGNKPLSSINLWMNRACSRSSTHYDPNHNLLCVVSGCKQVVLWPPSASPVLYPMALFGEASNHSSVDLVNPDFSLHSRAVNSKEYSQKIILRPGDALFIPEGWFHQVDSHDLTIAVNFWWESSMMSSMSEHMDAYYLRRILNRLVDKEMIVMLRSLEGCSNDFPKNDGLKGDSHFESNDQSTKEFMMSSDHLESHELNVLYELVSLVHGILSTVCRDDSSGLMEKTTGISRERNLNSTEAGCSSLVPTNPVASILWAVEPIGLRKVLLSMARKLPRTLEALIIHMLSPIAAEVLTRKFDKMDRETTKEQQTEFYAQFYSVFDDQYAAMDAILRGKELFSFQAFCSVADKYLGVSIDEDRTVQKGSFIRSQPSKSN